MRISLYSRGLKVFVWLCTGFGLCVLLGVALYLLLGTDEELYHVYSVIFFVLGAVLTTFFVIEHVKEDSMNSVVEIDKEGIKLISKKHYFKMKWNSIRLVGLTEPLGKSILFSDRADHRLLNTYITYKQLSASLIVIQNRKGLLEEVRKHWSGVIINEQRFTSK